MTPATNLRTCQLLGLIVSEPLLPSPFVKGTPDVSQVPYQDAR